MKLELEVLASTSIKRKKPWARLAWVGESQESIFLIDDHRLSVLYMPSGKTKRRINKLHGLLDDVTALNHSENGHFLVGVLRSGDLFLWHKDTDMLKYIQGLPELAQTLPNASNNANRPHAPTVPSKPCVYIADDGSKVAVVMNRCQLFVWESDPGQVLFAARQVDIKGSWSWVTPAPDVQVPQPRTPEAAIGVVFFINDTLGLCCMCSFVFTVDLSVCVTTAVLRWCETQDILTFSKPTFRVDWVSVQYRVPDLTPGGSPVRAPGAFLCRHSHDGQLLAVAVNQRSSHDNKLMFVSPLTDTITVADLKGSGAKIPVTRGYRGYWTTDLAWTYDDLFLILMTSQGGVAMVTRLGEPLLLKSFGCSIEMGPRTYLPLHPLISVQSVYNPDGVGEAESDPIADDPEAVALAESDPMRQRFSLAPHPRLPMFLCSDGYMVTALRLPGEMSCLSLMKGLLMESNCYLRRVRDQQKLNLTLYESMRRQGRVTKKLSLSAGVTGARRLVTDKNKKAGSQRMLPAPYTPYKFEEPGDDLMNNSLDESSSYLTAYGMDMAGGNMDTGKIMFGDLDNLNTTVDSEVACTEDNLSVIQLIDRAQRTLLLAWSLGASHTGLWTIEHEDAATNIAHNLVKLFSAILQTRPEHMPELFTTQSQHHPHSGALKNQKLLKVLHIIRTVFELLNFDCVHQHLMVCAIRFSHSILRLLLTDPELNRQEPHISNLNGCFVLLSFTEKVLASVYATLPKDFLMNSLPASLQRDFVDVFEPAVLSAPSNVLIEMSREKQQGYEIKGKGKKMRKVIRPVCEGDDQQERQLLGYISHKSGIQKRLCPSWKLLYKYTTEHLKVLDSQKVKRKVKRSALDLFVTLQMKLTSLGQGHLLFPRKRLKVRPGDRMSIEGCSVPALKAWMYQLNMAHDPIPSPGVLRSLLLASLYSLLIQDELRSAVELTELLIRQHDVKAAAATWRQDQAKKWSVLGLLQQMVTSSTVKPPCYIKNKAVKGVVKSLARVMAAYFSNKTMFVYPAHAPEIIPPLHKVYKIKHRIVPLYHESMAIVVGQDGLDGVWTPERAMDYLLLAGLLPEAVWFANRLGDWKTAYFIGVALTEHKVVVPGLYENYPCQLGLPEDLQPRAILQAKLEEAFGVANQAKAPVLLVDEESDLPHLRRTLMDLMMAATLSRIDLVPMLLETLVGRLKHVTRQFSGLVPDGLYLPAPPVYCPQPANTSQGGLDAEAFQEVALRHEASSLIQLVLLVLEGASCTLPAARWYAKKVLAAIDKGQRFKADSTTDLLEEVPVLQESFLQGDTSFSSQEADVSVGGVLSCFRDFTSLVWLLYIRDKLSLGLRKKIKLMERKNQKSHVVRETWLKLINETLEWATHLVPFAHFLEAESDIFGVTLSLIIELPTNQETCSLLSQFFYDAENLDSDLQDKLQLVLKGWQGVFIDGPQGAAGSIRHQQYPGKSPRGTSLSFYFHKQAQRMERIYRQKAKVFGEYEVFVFDPESEAQEEASKTPGLNNTLYIGARPFESERAFLVFLDVFFAVSFNKVLDAETEGALPKPLVLHNSAEVRQKELTSLAHKAVTSLHKRQALSNMNSPRRNTRQELSMSAHAEIPKTQSPRNKIPQSPRSKVGLFRSRSFGDLCNKNSKLPPFSPVVQRKKSTSQHDLTAFSDEEGFLEVHTTKPVSSPVSSPRRLKGKPTSLKSSLSGNPNVTAEGFTPHMSLSHRCFVRRSCSVNDVDKAKAEKEQAKLQPPTEDPLLKPVMPPWLLDRMEFGPGFENIEQLLEWLNRWAGRNHTLSTKVDHHVISGRSSLNGSQASLNLSHQGSPWKGLNTSTGRQGAAGSSSELLGGSVGSNPVIRIKVHPRMVVYALWLLEHHYFSTPRPCDSNPLYAPQAVQTRAGQAGTGTSLNTGAEARTNSGRSLTTGDCELELRDEAVPHEVKELVIPSSLGDGVPPEWLNEEEYLEESYMNQLLSAESNESISDGIIPKPKKSKMGILKKKDKKDVQKKIAKIKKEGDEATVSGTSETLLRRLPFKLRENIGGESQNNNAHNSSQVSDSTLNVSSLNEEEMHETIQQTFTSLQRQWPPTYKPPLTAKGLKPRNLEREYVVHEEMDMAAPSTVSERGMTVTPVSLSDTSREIEQGMPATTLSLPNTSIEIEKDDGLRSIVRQELRKIVEAQHQGILAMLGNLAEHDKAPKGSSTPHDHNPTHPTSKKADKRQRRKNKSHQPQDLSKEYHNMHTENIDVSLNDQSSITEIDITPLPSDEASLKSLPDRPLTVSDLVKSKTWSPGVKYDAYETGNNVRGALKELKSLENQSSNHVHFNLRGDEDSGRTGASLRTTAPDGKENRYFAMPLLTLTPNQGFVPGSTANRSQGGPATMGTSFPPPTENHQFSRVFQMLSVFNQKVGKPTGTSGFSNTDPNPGPRLLHVKREAPRLNFPSIPSGQRGQNAPLGAPRSAAPPRMPLLHMYTPHMVDEVPVRDVPLHLPQSQGPPLGPNTYRMPLLQLKPTAHQRIFHHIEDEEGELQLIPAYDVIAYEQNKQQRALLKKQQLRKAQKDLLGLSVGADETLPKDQRSSDKRKQRRKKTKEASSKAQGGHGTSLKLMNEAEEEHDELTSEKFVQAAPVETATQEIQVNYERTPREFASQAPQHPTPLPAASTEEDEEDEEEEDEHTHLHDGYALTRGIFDEYLMKDGEMGSAVDNAARLHYRAASALKPRKLKEVATETDGPGWMEQSTIISRDTGTDPVAEALESYMQAKKGLSAAGMLAPDIFMGLNFSEAGRPGPSTARSGGSSHAFINVVDLDGDALEDIVSSVSDQSEKAATGQRKPRKKELIREKRTRFETLDTEEEEEVEIRQGPDSVTSKVLGTKSRGQPGQQSVEDIVRSSRLNTKDSLRRRLQDMNVQFEAIDAMSHNIEEDYKNARLLLHTIEQIGEAIEPTPDLQREYPPARVLQDREERPEFTTKLQPSHIKKFNQKDKQKEEEQDKYSPIPEVSEDGLSSEERVQHIRRRLGQSDDKGDLLHEPAVIEDTERSGRNETQLDLTGLSGVSDIVGEVIASGAVDPAKLGFSDTQTRRLAQKALSARDTDPLELLRRSADKDTRLSRRTERDREEIRAWMETKKRDRQREFKLQQHQLREMEHHPYTPGDDSQLSTLTTKELEEMEQKRVMDKRQREQEHADKRLVMASELMGDILSERPVLPEAPVRPRTSSKSPVRHDVSASQRNKGTSPMRSEAPGGKATVTARGGRASHKVAWRENGAVDPDRTNLHANDYMQIRDSQDYDRHYRSQPATSGEVPGTMNLTRSGALTTQTGTSSAGLQAYSRHLAALQDSYDPLTEPKDQTSTSAPKADGVPRKSEEDAYKPKPYTELVKLQRPGVTRQQREFRPKPVPYVERLSQSQTGETLRSGTTADIKAKQKLYGSKHIPGSVQGTSRQAPRTIKTYQERLREMKQARKQQHVPFRPYTGPVPSPGAATVTISRSSGRSGSQRQRKPRRKPLTYAQQLQALQPPKELYRSGTGGMTPRRDQPAPRRKHAPPHKPMTYTEQLQKLQPPKELYRTGASYDEHTPQVYRVPRQGGLRRSGPYPDPYLPAQRGPDDDHNREDSVVSPWSMDDDVRHLLYDGTSSSYVGASHAGTDFDVSELQELAGVGSEEPSYVDLVNIQDIADAASFSSGSIMSFIDWDQVNQLIADVH